MSQARLEGLLVSRARQAELLGAEVSHAPSGEAERSVRRLRAIRARGAPAYALVGALLAEVRQHPDLAFREAFYAQIEPELNALAASVARGPDEARRAILEAFGQLSAQVSPERAAGFRRLLAAAAARDVELLLSTMRRAGGPAALAALEGVLLKTNAAALRDVLLEAASPELASYARALAGLPPLGQVEAIRALARIGERTTSFGARRLAACLREGWVSPRGDEWPSRLVRAVTGSGSGLKLLVALAAELDAAGERSEANRLSNALAGAVAAVRGHLQQAVAAVGSLEVRRATPQLAPARARALANLQHAGALGAAALEGAAEAWRGSKALAGHGRGHLRLAEQALLLLGTADVLGTTAAGRQLFAHLAMRAAAGEETSLRALPDAAAELGRPAMQPLLRGAGFLGQAFAEGGSGYLRRTGEAVVRSVAPLAVEQLRAKRWKEATSTCRALLIELGPLLGVTLAARGPLEQALGDVMASAGTERAQGALTQLDGLLSRPDEAVPVRVLAIEVVRALASGPVPLRVTERRAPSQAASLPVRVIAG